mmetsp:Transcript_78694/g.208959  ORF Transcript_78694/g.208959 Transcript_78694/m.208959 type:complete len:145 (+) Transcript_78694:285-719(+)
MVRIRTATVREDASLVQLERPTLSINADGYRLPRHGLHQIGLVVRVHSSVAEDAAVRDDHIAKAAWSADSLACLIGVAVCRAETMWPAVLAYKNAQSMLPPLQPLVPPVQSRNCCSLRAARTPVLICQAAESAPAAEKVQLALQ